MAESNDDIFQNLKNGEGVRDPAENKQWPGRHKLRSNKIKDGGSHVVAEQQLSSNKIKDGGSYVILQSIN